MAGGVFRDAGSAHGGREGSLQDRLVDVVSATAAGDRVHVHARGGEEPLPAKLPLGAWVLAGERVGQCDAAVAGG